MTSRRMTFSRLKEVYRRQDPPKWGAAYVPGILATREEAPAISWAAQMWSETLQRYIHALSRTEQSAVRLALFHPKLFDVQEQRMLPSERRQHPLIGHPRAIGMDLPDMPGTIAIADRLDVLKLHGWIRRKDEKAGRDLLVPLPYFGDLLLFLADDRGPYCVNWTIKQHEKDFQRSLNLHSRVRDQQKDTRAAQARHAIEEQLYWDAGIRTVRFVAATVPENLDHNLRNLYLHHRSTNALCEAVERELADRLRASLTNGEPPQSTILAITHRYGRDYQDVRQAFFRLLWERRVRVELIDEMVLVDRPLKPERNDVLQRFRHLFDREVCGK